jgi:membrane fusion protein (multidrug efflux system)
MDFADVSIRLLAAGFVTMIAGGAAWTKPAPGGPRAVGVAKATRQPITETGEFHGRIEAINRGFVTVVLEGVQPVRVLAIPGAAVLSDQQGDYGLAVGTDNEAGQRRIQRGQSSC